jgi:hypothetical protein
MFNPDKLNQEPESPEKPIEPEIKQEANSLERELGEKTLGEKFVAEYQTKEITKEQQERRKEHGGEEIMRGESTRFERGQIFKAYKILRKEIQVAEKSGEKAVGKRGLLKEIRGRAKVMEKDLDELERQMEENVKMVDVETEFGKFSIPVTEIDLRKGVEPGQEDKRTPYIFWGGIRSTTKMNGCAVMAMALAGQKVLVPMHLEQEAVGKPENFLETMKQQKSFKPHAKITKELIKNLGLGSCNIMGYSAGAGIALESAIELSNDPEMKGVINNLIVMEPLGLDEKGIVGLAADFGKDAVTRVMPSAEAGIKVMRQGGETNKEDQKLDWETIKILASKQFTPERLAEINVGGNFQWWVGRSSAVTNLPLTERVMEKIQTIKKEKGLDTPSPELNEVVGGTHSLLNMNALGLAEMIVEERQNTQSAEPRVIKRKDLAFKRN